MTGSRTKERKRGGTRKHSGAIENNIKEGNNEKMAKGKEKEGSGFAMAGLRDIKEDIVKGLGNSLPALERFFKTLSVPVWLTDTALEIIKNAQELDGPE